MPDHIRLSALGNPRDSQEVSQGPPGPWLDAPTRSYSEMPSAAFAFWMA